MRYAIEAKYILYRDSLISGYICIKGQHIRHILPGLQEHPKLLKYPITYKYHHQVVMPAAIDTNVSLTMWNQVEEFSKLALVGGVSLIINKPYSLTLEATQLQLYQQQVESLNKDCIVDFIQSAMLNSKTDITELLQMGVFCFQANLMPTLMGTHCNDIAELVTSIKQLPDTCCLFWHMQCAIDKDLAITSPYRTKPMHQRLSIEQIDTFDPDGVQGHFSSDDEVADLNCPHYQQQIQYLNQDNTPLKQLIKQYKKAELELTQDAVLHDDESPIISANLFKNESKTVAASSQFSLISRAELFTYQEKPKMETGYKFPDEGPECSTQSPEQQLQNSDQQQIKPQISPQFKIHQQDTYQSPEMHSQKVISQNQSYIAEKYQSQSPLPTIPAQHDQSTPNSSNLQIDTNKHKSPDISVQSSEISSPDTVSQGSNKRLRARANTQSLLQRRQSMKGFQLVIHQVETNAQKHGSGDQLHINYSESRIRCKQPPKFNTDYLCFLAFRPTTWEKFAIARVKKVIKQQFQCKLILSDYSSSLALAEIKHLLSPQVYSDISYPHLLLDSNCIEDGQTKFKSDPPIRQKENKRLLQKAMGQINWVSSVSSQHLYVNPIYKLDDFRRAISGICTVGCNFQALWTILLCQKKQTPQLLKEAMLSMDKNNPLYNKLTRKLCQLQQLLSTGAAQYLGLKDRGRIEVGYLADLVVFDPLKPCKFNPTKLKEDLNLNFAQDKHIFNRKLLLGSVDYVFIRGQLVLEKDQESKQVHIFNRKGQQILKQ